MSSAREGGVVVVVLNRSVRVARAALRGVRGALLA